VWTRQIIARVRHVSVAIGVAALVTPAACGNRRPSVAAGERAIRESFDSTGVLSLQAFAKSDGRYEEIGGMGTYDMVFSADLSVSRDALYSVTRAGMAAMIGPQEGNRIHTQPYRDLSRAGLESFFYAANGLRPTRRGDVFHLEGDIGFEKRESGWVQTTLDFRVTVDSNARRRQ
jgi:hypothetical protein